jgi:DNA repair protein RecN (Recombination protein N)
MALPTVIFDEIDTGVSGDVAERVGHLLKEMGQYRQLLAITHLPQVAACGQYHLSVRKSLLNDKMVSSVVSLDAESRQQEIAQLLSGETITEAALANANELIRKHDSK